MKIPLTKGYWAEIDDEDYELIRSYSWFVIEARNTQYVGTTTRQKNNSTLRLHNLLLPPRPGLEVDHRDWNGLNNRRLNLEYVTHSENIRRGRYAPGKSGVRGVYFHPSGRWHVRASINGKRVSGGYFDNFDVAVEAYKCLTATSKIG